MTDLISRADAIEAVRKKLQDWCGYAFEDYRRGLYEAQEIIEALPSADAVSREQYDCVCEEYNRLVHNAICIKLCDENCEYEKEKTCYHAREHYAVDSVLSADAVSREECDECKTDKEGVLLQQLAELQGDYETMKNAYEDALADAEWIPCSERLPKEEDFGTLCICALRYCHGRRTYMPSLVQGIVGRHLEEFSDNTINVMVDDCQFQRDMNLYGDECDRIDWLKWEQKVKAEQKRRKL